MSKSAITMVACLCLAATFFDGYSQGCSDAGFCTMGAMRPDQSYSKKFNIKPRSVEFNYYRGETTLSPIITVFTADMSFTVGEKYSAQLKVPYQMVEGSLGTNKGFGDISFSLSRSVGQIGNYNITATVGGKIPTGYANDKSNKQEFGTGTNDPGPMPMYYQVSLGTYDVVAGASMINDKWLFATGIQIPVIHKNNNDFRWGRWGDYPNPEYIEKYFLANELKRGVDIMLRAERNFRFLNYNFSVGMLPIYRISRDKRYDFNTDKEIKEDGTTGLALSALASAGYQFDVSNSMKLIYGHKITQREVNPDGLTRHAVLSLSYIYKF